MSLTRKIARTEQQIADADRRIAHQHALIAEIVKLGRSTESAEDILQTMLLLQERRRRDLAYWRDKARLRDEA